MVGLIGSIAALTLLPVPRRVVLARQLMRRSAGLIAADALLPVLALVVLRRQTVRVVVRLRAAGADRPMPVAVKFRVRIAVRRYTRLGAAHRALTPVVRRVADKRLAVLVLNALISLHRHLRRAAGIMVLVRLVAHLKHGVHRVAVLRVQRHVHRIAGGRCPRLAALHPVLHVGAQTGQLTLGRVRLGSRHAGHAGGRFHVRQGDGERPSPVLVRHRGGVEVGVIRHIDIQRVGAHVDGLRHEFTGFLHLIFQRELVVGIGKRQRIPMDGIQLLKPNILIGLCLTAIGCLVRRAGIIFEIAGRCRPLGDGDRQGHRIGGAVLPCIAVLRLDLHRVGAGLGVYIGALNGYIVRFVVIGIPFKDEVPTISIHHVRSGHGNRHNARVPGHRHRSGFGHLLCLRVSVPHIVHRVLVNGAVRRFLVQRHLGGVTVVAARCPCLSVLAVLHQAAGAGDEAVGGVALVGHPDPQTRRRLRRVLRRGVGQPQLQFLRQLAVIAGELHPRVAVPACAQRAVHVLYRVLVALREIVVAIRRYLEIRDIRHALERQRLAVRRQLAAVFVHADLHALAQMDGRFELCFPHVQVAAVGHDLKTVLVREEKSGFGIVICDSNPGIGIILRSNADARTVPLHIQTQTGSAERKAIAHIQVIVLIFIGRVIDGAGIVVDLHLTDQLHVIAADAHTAAAGKGIAAELRLVVMDLDHTAAGGADIQRTLGKDTGALAIKPVTARRADIILDNAVFYLRRGAAGVVQAAAIAAGILVGRLSRPGVGIVQRLVAGDGAVLHGEGSLGVEHTAATLGAVVGEGHHRVVADGSLLHDERALVEHTTAAVVGVVGAVTAGGFAQKRHSVAGDEAVMHGELTRVVYVYTAAALIDRGVITDLAPVQVECAPHVDKHTAAGAVAALLPEPSGVAGDRAAVHVERSAGNSYTAGAVVAEIAGDAAAPQVEGSGGAVAAVADIHGSARSLLAQSILAVSHLAGGLAVRQVEGNAAVHLDHAALVAVFADDAVSVQAQLHAAHRLPDVVADGIIKFHFHVVQQVIVARRGDGLQAADARPCRLIVVGKVAAVGCIVTHAHAVGVGAVLRALHPQAAAARRQRIRRVVAVESCLHSGIGMLHHKTGNDLRADADVALGGVKGTVLHGAGVRAGVGRPAAIPAVEKSHAHIVGRTVGQLVVLDTDDASSVARRAVADDETIITALCFILLDIGIAFVIHTAAALGRRVAGNGTAQHKEAAGTAVYTAAVAGGGVIPDNAARLHGQHAAGHIHRTLV